MAEQKKKGSGCLTSLLLGILVVIVLTLFFSCGSGEEKKEIPKYEAGESSVYVRDGQECIAYRVVIDPKLSDSDLQLVFKDVTADDGYYLHTVWFYDSMESGADGSNAYNVAMLEEIEEGQNPKLTK